MIMCLLLGRFISKWISYSMFKILLQLVILNCFVSFAFAKETNVSWPIMAKKDLTFIHDKINSTVPVKRFKEFPRLQSYSSWLENGLHESIQLAKKSVSIQCAAREMNSHLHSRGRTTILPLENPPLFKGIRIKTCDYMFLC